MVCIHVVCRCHGNELFKHLLKIAFILQIKIVAVVSRLKRFRSHRLSRFQGSLLIQLFKILTLAYIKHYF